MSEITMFQQKLCKNQGHNWNINMSNMIYIYIQYVHISEIIFTKTKELPKKIINSIVNTENLNSENFL